MILQWKEYVINLSLFDEWLRENQPKTDGLVATKDELTVVEIEALTPEEVQQIQAYYDQLDEHVTTYTENELRLAVTEKKQEILIKDITTLTQVEKKILLNMELTEQEKHDLVNE